MVGSAPWVEPGFWYGARMRAALAGRDLRVVCRLYRLEAGLSQTDLGLLLGMEQSEVSTIESGRRSVRDIAVLERLRDALGVPGHLLGLASGPSENPPPIDSVNESADTTRGEDPTNRREFTTAALLAAMGAMEPLRGLFTAPPPRTVTRTYVEEVEAALPQLYALDNQYGGDELCSLSIRCCNRVRQMLEESSYEEAVGRALQSTEAGFAENAGWVLFDADRQRAARSYYTEALCAARLAEDERLATLVLADMSLQARYLERSREAVSLARAGQDAAAGWATPRVAALLAAREARARAALRDESGFRKAMTQAKRSFEGGFHDDDPSWVTWFNTAELVADEGTGFGELEKHDRAERLLRDALDAQEADYQRNRAIRIPQLATTMFRQGDIAPAAELASGVVPLFEEVSSTRSLRHLGDLHDEMLPHQRISAVADFTERFRAIVTRGKGAQDGNR